MGKLGKAFGAVVLGLGLYATVGLIKSAGVVDISDPGRTSINDLARDIQYRNGGVFYFRTDRQIPELSGVRDSSNEYMLEIAFDLDGNKSTAEFVSRTPVEKKYLEKARRAQEILKSNEVIVLGAVRGDNFESYFIISADGKRSANIPESYVRMERHTVILEADWPPSGKRIVMVNPSRLFGGD